MSRNYQKIKLQQRRTTKPKFGVFFEKDKLDKLLLKLIWGVCHNKIRTKKESNVTTDRVEI